MLEFGEALVRLLADAHPVGETEAVPTWAAAGRVLATGLSSAIDVPPLDNTSMDGYAVRCADVPAGGAKRSPKIAVWPLAVKASATTGTSSAASNPSTSGRRVTTSAYE
jgi:molybdopterin molybdotransferase